MNQRKVMLIVIDGCRPDGIAKTLTPNIDSMVQDGAHSFSAETVSPPLTLPAHFSIFSSRQPVNHNVLTNTGRPDISPDTFTVFEAARYNRLSTAAYYSWEQLRNLTPPGVLDQSIMERTLGLPLEPQDLRFIKMVTPSIVRTAPDLCFVYLEGVDAAGHKHGWMSNEYLTAISNADKALGFLLGTLEDIGLKNSYNVMVFSDHGGVDTHHMDPLPEVLTIPWIAAGPDIAQGIVLDKDITVLDIAPTAAALLQIPSHWSWEGRVVSEMFVHKEKIECLCR